MLTGQEARALDAWITREPEWRYQGSLLRCDRCGRFVTSEIAHRVDVVQEAHCDGRAWWSECGERGAHDPHEYLETTCMVTYRACKGHYAREWDY